jgi:hypothetical protein
MFNHPVFMTYVVKIDLPEDWLRHYPQLSRESAEELHQFRWCLADAKRRMPNGYVLIIKDNSIINVTSQNLAELIVTACQNETWQLCYLSKWLDRCDLHRNKISPPGSTIFLVKTRLPHGCQAILFSPEGRDIVLKEKKMKNGQDFNVTTSLSASLNQAIDRGYIDANCFIPNLISYDLTYDLTSIQQTNDYYKCQECRRPDTVSNVKRIPVAQGEEKAPVTQRVEKATVTQTNNGNGISTWLWILFIFVLILFGVWFMYSRRR